MLNSVILEGRALEIRKFNDKTELIIESDRSIRNSEGEVETISEKFTSEAYGNYLKFIDQWVETGRGVRAVGHLSERIWKDSDGENHSTAVIVIEHLEVKPKYNK